MTKKEIKEVLEKTIKDVTKRAQQNLEDNEKYLFHFNEGYACGLSMVCQYFLSEDEE